jgi:hypothetical protein
LYDEYGKTGTSDLILLSDSMKKQNQHPKEFAQMLKDISDLGGPQEG